MIPTEERGTPDHRSDLPGRLVLVAVLLAALAQAGVVYVRFLNDHRTLWSQPLHDRNAHYLYTLKLATALRGGDVIGFLGELCKAAVWPPLHGVLSGIAVAIGGLDYRLAVLPNLFARVGTVLLAFLIARRCAPQAGTVAGVLAAAFVLASPSHISYATDLMFESLGACLTLACLYAYLRCVQDDRLADYGLLGLCLTLMLLLKYNYWVLVVAALTMAELSARWRTYLPLAVQQVRALDWRGLLSRELRQPISWLLALTLLVIGAILVRGPRPLLIGDQAMRIHPPGNIANLAYGLLLLRLALLARPWGQTLTRFDPRLCRLILWHAVPAALFFLLPRHLSSFLWYVSPANSPDSRMSLVEGARFYADFAVTHYHLSAWLAGTVAGLFVLALVCAPRLRPGSAAVLLLGLISALLTAMHPNHQGRYLHSWIAAVWVGAALAVVTLPVLLPSTRRRLPAAVAAALALLLAAWQVPGIVEGRRSLAAGPLPGQPTTLDLTDLVLKQAEQSDRMTVLSMVPLRFPVQWAYLQRFGTLDGLEDHFFGFGPKGESNRAAFSRWLGSNHCDTLLYLERVRGPISVHDDLEVAVHRELRDLLDRQTTFTLTETRLLPQHDTRVLIFRRATGRELAGK